MNLLDTIDHFIREQESQLESLSWEIHEETNFEDNLVDRLAEDYDYHDEHLKNLKTIRELIANTKDELARLKRYDEELSAIMPKDFKDWWENSKEEWPIVARGVIENLRKREELAWEQVNLISEGFRGTYE